LFKTGRIEMEKKKAKAKKLTVEDVSEMVYAVKRDVDGLTVLNVDNRLRNLEKLALKDARDEGTPPYPRVLPGSEIHVIDASKFAQGVIGTFLRVVETAPDRFVIEYSSAYNLAKELVWQDVEVCKDLVELYAFALARKLAEKS
jgi:hypothetical protein